jgi:hypothetical protein
METLTSRKAIVILLLLIAIGLLGNLFVQIARGGAPSTAATLASPQQVYEVFQPLAGGGSAANLLAGGGPAAGPGVYGGAWAIYAYIDRDGRPWICYFERPLYDPANPRPGITRVGYEFVINDCTRGFAEWRAANESSRR